MVDLAERYAQFAALVRGANRLFLGIPEGPDGDSVGSMLALALMGDALGKRTVTCYSPEAIPPSLLFLPGVERIIVGGGEDAFAAADLAVFVDTGDVRRVKLDHALLGRDRVRTTVVNLDHHQIGPANPVADAIDLHIIDPSASAACELVFRYLVSVGHPVTKDIATCLLTGILTDTGGFSNLGTTFRSLGVAAELLKRGANIAVIADRTQKNKSIGALKLWGIALSRLERNPRSGIVTTVITQEDLRGCDVEEDATEGIANFLNALEDANAVLVLREEPGGLIKGSFRTTKPDMDVSRLAQAYGGGGHKKAAGFTVRGRLERTPGGWHVVR